MLLGNFRVSSSSSCFASTNFSCRKRSRAGHKGKEAMSFLSLISCEDYSMITSVHLYLSTPIAEEIYSSSKPSRLNSDLLWHYPKIEDIDQPLSNSKWKDWGWHSINTVSSMIFAMAYWALLWIGVSSGKPITWVWSQSACLLDDKKLVVTLSDSSIDSTIFFRRHKTASEQWIR